MIKLKWKLKKKLQKKSNRLKKIWNNKLLNNLMK